MEPINNWQVVFDPDFGNNYLDYIPLFFYLVLHLTLPDLEKPLLLCLIKVPCLHNISNEELRTSTWKFTWWSNYWIHPGLFHGWQVSTLIKVQAWFLFIQHFTSTCRQLLLGWTSSRVLPVMASRDDDHPTYSRPKCITFLSKCFELRA
jgi:hypothetical protein